MLYQSKQASRHLYLLYTHAPLAQSTPKYCITLSTDAYDVIQVEKFLLELLEGEGGVALHQHHFPNTISPWLVMDESFSGIHMLGA